MAIKIANVVLPRLVNTWAADDLVMQGIGNSDNEFGLLLLKYFGLSVRRVNTLKPTFSNAFS